MRYFWLSVIAVSVIPSAIASVLLNPFVFFVLGPERWREELNRLHPYRWWFGASVAALVVATATWAVTYG